MRVIYLIFTISHYSCKEQSESKPTAISSFSPSLDMLTPSSVRIMKVHPLEGK